MAKEADKKKRRKDQITKIVPKGKMYITATFNNTLATFTDPEGNVIQPKYREYGMLSIAFIYFLLSPTYFLEKLKVLGNRIINRLFKH